jgi:hypothetical protein
MVQTTATGTLAGLAVFHVSGVFALLHAANDSLDQRGTVSASVSYPASRFCTYSDTPIQPGNKPSQINIEMGYRNTLIYCFGSVPCDPGTFNSQANEAYCYACDIDTYASMHGATLCLPCLQMCPVGTYYVKACSVTQNTQCLKCAEGKYGDGVSCFDCPPGTFAVNIGSSVCVQCVAGTYSSSNAIACVNCTNGKYSNAGSSFCLDCPTGLHAGTGYSVCSQCDTGTYSSSSDILCTPCMAGKYSTVQNAFQESSCLSCDAGKYSTGVGAGKFPVQFVLTNPKATWLSGIYKINSLFKNGHPTYLFGQFCMWYYPLYNLWATYSECLGSNSGYTDAFSYDISPMLSSIEYCYLCDAGKYGPEYGASSATKCLECSKGTYSTALAKTSISCDSCPPGNYASKSGSSYCEKCSPGTISGIGSTQCDNCPPNHFQSEYGKSYCNGCSLTLTCIGQTLISCKKDSDAFCTSCTPIPNGVYSPSSSNCVALCNPGFQLVGSSVCIQCPPGTFNDKFASSCKPWTSVTECTEKNFFFVNGTRFDDSRCLKCPDLLPSASSAMASDPLYPNSCKWQCNDGYESATQEMR